MLTRKLSSSIVAAAFACAFAAGAVSFAHADTVTALVKSWDPVTGKLVLRSGEVFLVDVKKIPVPESLTHGNSVTIDYVSNDNGVTGINSVTIAR